MYVYNDFDEAFVRARVAQFRGQVERRIDGSLTEDEFKPLRLMNGLYLQLHAYMLRVAVPYGTLNPVQMRQLAYIADKWDKGYGHFTTRQNIQYNWPKLQDVPEMLEALADVGMHAIQTSGNTIRRVQQAAITLGPQYVYWREAGWVEDVDLHPGDQRCLLVAKRTDPDAAKHGGISAFVVDMKAPGIDIRPLREMTGTSDLPCSGSIFRSPIFFGYWNGSRFPSHSC